MHEGSSEIPQFISGRHGSLFVFLINLRTKKCVKKQ